MHVSAFIHRHSYIFTTDIKSILLYCAFLSLLSGGAVNVLMEILRTQTNKQTNKQTSWGCGP